MAPRQFYDYRATMDKILATGALSEIRAATGAREVTPWLAPTIPSWCWSRSLPTRWPPRSAARSSGSGARPARTNLVPGIRSLYSWDGALQDDAEILALLKTTRAALPSLEARIAELHPYDTPEVVALEPAHVEARYLAWLRGSVGPAAPGDAS